MSEQQNLWNRIVILRAAVWGQALGMLIIAIIIMIDDAPDIFKNVDIWDLIWPPVAIILVQIKRLSSFFARNLSLGVLTLFISIVSISTAIIAITNIDFMFSIPAYLVTESWKYSQWGSIIVGVIFSAALIINASLIIRAFRAQAK